jgi:hypothetical protein
MMIVPGFPMEVLLSSAYAVFLLIIAAVLEALAKHSQRRADQYELAGFRYHPGFDRWECPEGNHLVRVDSDPSRCTVRYRAPARYCNGCKRKGDCTDSDSGRDIEHHLDLWLQTGLRQFHRGLSLTLIVLAGLLLVIEAARYPERNCMTLLAILFSAVGVFGLRLLWPLRANEATPTELR